MKPGQSQRIFKYYGLCSQNSFSQNLRIFVLVAIISLLTPMVIAFFNGYAWIFRATQRRGE